MFKIETKMISDKNDENQTKLELGCELIHNDYGNEKVVGVFEGKISDHNVK